MRISRVGCRLLAGSALSAVAVLAGAATASAATAPAPVPTAGCYFVNSNGTITAVFGYTNKGGAGTITHGSNNYVITGHEPQDAGIPTQTQPTSFTTGSFGSVWTVNAPGDGYASWYLNGTWATVSTHDNASYGVTRAPICGQGTSLPATNGVVTTVLGFALIVPLGGWALSRRRTRLGGRA